MSTSQPLMALVDIHGTAIKLSAEEGRLTAERFKLYVEKVRRLAMSFTPADVEIIRDELLILAVFSKGVPLSSLLSFHPISAQADDAGDDAAHIFIKTFDPHIHVTPQPDEEWSTRPLRAILRRDQFAAELGAEQFSVIKLCEAPNVEVLIAAAEEVPSGLKLKSSQYSRADT